MTPATPTTPTSPSALLDDAPFSERHTRTVDAPVDVVWRACTHVTAAEIRLLGPLMNLRALPSRLRRRSTTSIANDARRRAFLETFSAEGFVILHCDEAPVDGRASLDFGGAGRFWSASANEPMRFNDPDEFIEFARRRDRPDLAVTVADLCAIDNGDGTTTVTTETRVIGTDAASTRRFGRYWALIRLGSGAIRRSWLAAIDRRAVG
ncbi:MAG: hypothetical protein AAF081_15770 [Actinomycetota bacterium]